MGAGRQRRRTDRAAWRLLVFELDTMPLGRFLVLGSLLLDDCCTATSAADGEDDQQQDEDAAIAPIAIHTGLAYHLPPRFTLMSTSMSFPGFWKSCDADMDIVVPADTSDADVGCGA